MSAPIAFKSSREYEEERRQKRESRANYLDKVKKEYEKDERKKEKAKQKGDDVWMLPSVSNRVELESSKHKKKEKKKHKKDKKRKKKKHRDEESSDSDSDEPTWVEKGCDEETPMETDTSNSTKPVKGPALMPQDWKPEREEWMAAPMDLIPCVTRDELREKIKKDKKEKEEEVNLLDKPGQHALELNPFWKDGGTGVPEESPAKSTETSQPVLYGDGGVSWLKKAYKRCVEQVKEENRTLEDIAAERYGSLEKLESMITDAERTLEKKKEDERLSRMQERSRRHGHREEDQKQERDERSSQRRHSRSRSRENDRYTGRSCSSQRDSRQKRSRSRSRDRERRSRSGSRDRYSSHHHRGSSHSKSRGHRRHSPSGSAEDDSGQRSPTRERHRKRSRSRSKGRESSSKYKFMKPGDNDSGSYRRQFCKPGDLDEPPKRTFMNIDDKTNIRSRFRKPDSESDNESGSRSYKSNSDSKKSRPRSDRHGEKSSDKEYVPAWKKREFMKPGDEKEGKSTVIDRNEIERREKAPAWKKEVPKAPSPKRRDVSDDSSSSSESSDSESSEEEAPPVPVLSEQEMNALGAKIVKAELMGNEELAAKLKSQLELARSAKEAHASRATTSGGKKTKQKGDEPEDVLLTTTTRSGVAMPLPDRKTPREATGGRRKKQKVATHGSSGERERYFADDDKYDLKTMFQREKLGTAEDPDRMFARLAGKAMEKTDDDYQVDDVFVNRANKKMSESKEEDRQRSDAISQHKKMASALSRCELCLEKCPKHLIIAIGIRCYLSLPNCQSLVEGHCQIVPIQHASAGTSVDEDVWNEVQVFRKGLTKMFEEKEMDCVFMETVTGLKWQPHMVMDCVPMPRETGDMAPIYFKKAIQESESEWAQNKKLVDLRGKDIRRSVPKGFPYFSVDFGLQGGFAHVIEDEKTFPKYFGKEIVGGMLDLEPRLWRKPMKENFDSQRTKVLQFSKWWKPFDWTLQLSKNEED